MNKPLSALGLLGLLLVLILAPVGASAATISQATITTYNIPFWFTVKSNATVPAGGNATVILPMPYPVDPDKAIIRYRIMDADGNLLTNVSNVQLDIVINNATKLTSIYLSSSSPAEAEIPLSMSGVSNVSDISVVVKNPLSSDVNTNIQVTVTDTAKFSVSINPTHLELPKGGKGQLVLTVQQTGGPAGELYFTADTPGGFTVSYSPVQVTTYKGTQHSTTVTISTSSTVKPGDYTITLKGTFTPKTSYKQPESAEITAYGNVTYTFAEVALPLVIEAAAPGAAGLALGSLMGYSLGMWGVALALLVFIGVVAFIISRMGR